MNTLYFRLLFVSLFFLYSSAALIAQKKQKQIPGPVSKPAVPVRPAPKPKPVPAPVQTPSKPPEKTYYAYLLVTTDLDVKLSVNGDRSFTIHAVDDIVKIGLDQNDNLIRVTPLDDGSDGYTFTQKAERPGNIVLAIDLGAKRSVTLKAEEARKRKLEVDRAAIEAPKTEENRKQEADLIANLQNQIAEESDTIILYALYGQLIDILKNRIQEDPENYTDTLVVAYNSHAWYGFFLQQFKTTEQDIRAGIAVDSTFNYLYTNLAPALLLQGHYEAARIEYLKWKDQPFEEQDLATYRDAFLIDLDVFEKAGIIPAARKKDVEKIRALLKE